MPTISEAMANFVQQGNAFQAQGKLNEAVACYRRALELSPEYAAAHYMLGTALQAQGRLNGAIDSYRRALDLRPDHAESHNNLGNALRTQGELEEAVACFRRAIELKPQYAEAYSNLGNAFQGQRKLDDAVACYHRALELNPDQAVVNFNLGTAFQAQGKLEEAAVCYRRTLDLKPDLAEAHNNLGNVLQIEGKPDEAIESYHRALERKPDYAVAQCNLGTALKDQGKLDEAIACFRRTFEQRPDYFAHRSLLYSIWFCPDVDSAAIYEEHRRWYRQWAEPLARHIAPHTNDASPNRKLRIGYVSPDFRNHCLSLFFVPIFSAHDRQQFEIVCYSDVTSPDSLTARLRSVVDKWRSIVGFSHEDVAQMVRQDQIDILVDLTMHMEHSRLLMFARKPAPLQVCGLAYPGSTGLKTIDYRFTDLYLDPSGLNDAYYSEQSIRLENCVWCYDPLTEGPAVNSLPALNNGHVTFGCLNSFCKVNAGVLKLWARVLSAVEGSRLLLLAPEGSARQSVLEILGTAGISAERITFVARQPRASYLELYNQIDIGLDTFPYNGHTTSLDSFWMGVPVVTLVGKTVVGRAGLCQLQNLGLPELVAHAPEQFVEISVGLANDLSRLSQLRATLRERIEKSPLMDAPRFTQSLEAAYRSIWQRWCAARDR